MSKTGFVDMYNYKQIARGVHVRGFGCHKSIKIRRSRKGFC